MKNIEIAVILALSCSMIQVLFRGFALFFQKKISENLSRIVGSTLITAQLFLFFVANILFWTSGVQTTEINLPQWFHLDHYFFESTLLIDKYALIHSLLTSSLLALILKYSFQYLHREKGHNRFFFLISVLSFGLSFVSFSGSFDTLFIGWELIGISSVLLIAFFNTNTRSIQNSFRTLVYYRLSDAAMLMASALLHKTFHSNIFSAFVGHDTATVSSVIGFLILFASLAKSAQLPFVSWLPRAMEGPTSSSAVYYGALSVHLGPFLLLRTASVWSIHPAVTTVMIINGLLTFVFATLSGRTKTDIKSQLGFYTIAQIGLMYVELALGLYNIVLIHIVLHAIYRTMSFLRSSSWIQDVQENQTLYDLARIKTQKLSTSRFSKSLHHFAQHSFYLDYIHQRLIMEPLNRVFGILYNIKLKTPIVPIFIFAITVGYVAFSDKSISERVHDLSIACLIASFYNSAVSLSSKSLKESLHHLIFSLIGLFAIFCIEYQSHFRMICIVACISLLLYSTLTWVQSIISKQHPHLKLTEYFGFTHHNPELSALFFLAGMILIGLPGGLYFIVEDIVFHNLLEYSAVATFGFIFLTVFNALSFYRIFCSIFLGPAIDINPLQYSRVRTWSVYAIIIATFILGIAPSIYMR